MIHIYLTYQWESVRDSQPCCELQTRSDQMIWQDRRLRVRSCLHRPTLYSGARGLGQRARKHVIDLPRPAGMSGRWLRDDNRCNNDRNWKSPEGKTRTTGLFLNSLRNISNHIRRATLETFIVFVWNLLQPFNDCVEDPGVRISSGITGDLRKGGSFAGWMSVISRI